MTDFKKRGWVGAVLLGLMISGMTVQAVYAQFRAPARSGLDPFVTGSLTDGSGEMTVKRPPTRDPVRPGLRSPFVP